VCGEPRGAAALVVCGVELHEIEAGEARAGGGVDDPCFGEGWGPAAGVEGADAGGEGAVEDVEVEAGELRGVGRQAWAAWFFDASAVGAEPVEVLAGGDEGVEAAVDEGADAADGDEASEGHTAAEGVADVEVSVGVLASGEVDAA
jgi:hypothetical protein